MDRIEPLPENCKMVQSKKTVHGSNKDPSSFFFVLTDESSIATPASSKVVLQNWTNNLIWKWRGHGSHLPTTGTGQHTRMSCCLASSLPKPTGDAPKLIWPRTSALATGAISLPIIWGVQGRKHDALIIVCSCYLFIKKYYLFISFDKRKFNQRARLNCYTTMHPFCIARTCA